MNWAAMALKAPTPQSFFSLPLALRKFGYGLYSPPISPLTGIPADSFFPEVLIRLLSSSFQVVASRNSEKPLDFFLGFGNTRGLPRVSKKLLVGPDSSALFFL